MASALVVVRAVRERPLGVGKGLPARPIIRHAIRESVLEVSVVDGLGPGEGKRKKHQGQKRQFSGDDYISHPIAVANIVGLWNWPEWVQAVAVLHDVIEDTDTTYEELLDLFGKRIADAVRTLSLKNGESYLDYLLRVEQFEESSIVKLADIQHNLSDMPERNRTMRAKYELAGHILRCGRVRQEEYAREIGIPKEDLVTYLEMARISMEFETTRFNIADRLDLSEKEIQRLQDQIEERMNRD